MLNIILYLLCPKIKVISYTHGPKCFDGQRIYYCCKEGREGCRYFYMNDLLACPRPTLLLETCKQRVECMKRDKHLILPCIFITEEVGTRKVLAIDFVLTIGFVLLLSFRYSRDWRYHKEDKIWITRAPGLAPLEKTSSFERGTYYFFDVNSWK